MTPQIVGLLAIVAAAIVLFWFEWLSAEVVGIGVLLALVLSGMVPVDKAFAGFGSDIVIMILGLLIMNAALMRTGVVDMAGRAILRRAGNDAHRLATVLTIAAATLSAFISNTAAAAFFLPVAIGVARRSGVSASKLLMPLAFASILTSSVTLISTSTNLVVSGLMTRYDMDDLGMFELSPVGIPIAIVGLVYVLTVGRRLIPDRGRGGDVNDTFGLSPYLGELLVLEGAPVVGRTLAESAFGEEYDLNVVCVVRGDERRAPVADLALEAGDVLIVQGDRESLLKIKNVRGLELHPEVKFSYVESDNLGLAEVLLMPRSPLIGRTLRTNRFRERFGLQVLAIARHGETLRTKLRDVRLNLGDVLLVQGPRGRLRALQDYETFRVLGAVEEKPPQIQFARRATTIFAASLALAATGLLELPVAVLLGAFVAFVTRCITPEEAWRSIEWKAILLIGSLLSLGVAMEETGTAQLLAAALVHLVGNGAPEGLLSAVFLLTVLLTQPMSNQAASIVILPIAVKAAIQLGFDPRPFAVMVAVAASTSYITPLEPACLLVYGPGRYRFTDFVRVGAPLTLLVYAIAILIVPRVWPA